MRSMGRPLVRGRPCRILRLASKYENLVNAIGLRDSATSGGLTLRNRDAA